MHDRRGIGLSRVMPASAEHLSIVLIHRADAARVAIGRQLDEVAGAVVIASVRLPETGLSAFAEQPDSIVVLQQQAPDETGRLACLEEIRQVNPRARVVVVFDDLDDGMTTAAVRSGAAAVVRADTAAFADVVRLVAAGLTSFDPGVVAGLIGTLADVPTNPLSARERDVLSCLAIGLSNAEAAAKLFVSRETVKTHVSHVLRKLNVDDRVAAVHKATRIGLLA